MSVNRSLVSMAGLLAVAILFSFSQKKAQDPLAAEVINESSLVRIENGFAYRDLNKNGKMDVYEDSKQPIESRVQDLLRQMTLEEKAGMMFYSPVRVNADGSIEEQPAKDFLASFSPVGITEMDKRHITHFNLFTVHAIDTLAIWYNRMQQYAEKTRLGIPLTIASDPRNQATGGFFSQSAKTFSGWPEPLGLAAIGDEN